MEELQALLEEWRTLRNDTHIVAQNMDKVRSQDFKHVDGEKLVRRHDLAKTLVERMDDLDVNPVERHELQLDAK